jgi:hypothetical protein
MRSRRPLILASVLAAAVFSLLAAGCGGGGGSPGVANVASTTTAAASRQGASNGQPATAYGRGLVAFADCMRSNGLASFPSPQDVSGRTMKLTIQQDSGNNPHFQSAMRACKNLLPNRGSAPQQTPQQQRAQVADALSFARCVRGHGVARFPDPNAQGQLSVETVEAQGIDIHSPRFCRRCGRVCRRRTAC